MLSVLKFVEDRNLDSEKLQSRFTVQKSHFHPDYPRSRRSVLAVDCRWLNLSGRIFDLAVTASDDVVNDEGAILALQSLILHLLIINQL
jgi:hypothetical protein